MYFEAERDKRAYYSITDNVCGAHFHRSVELLYVLTGEKPVRLNGEEYLLKPGQLLICPPYTVHLFFAGRDSEQIVAALPPDYCRRFESFCETHTPERPFLDDGDGTLLKLTSALQNADNEVLLEGLAGCIFGIYMQRVRFSPSKRPPDRAPVQKIAEYIDEHYASPLTLEGLAAQFGYSPNYFSALFKKYFMTGVTQYVNSVRVQKSLPLLKTRKVSAVYFLCGFQSPQQYFLNFRKFFGCTPCEYIHSKKSVRQ